MSPLRPALRLLGIVALGMTLLAPARAAQPEPALSRDAAVALLRQDGGETIVYRDPETGVPTFVGGALPAIRASVATPQAAARAFFTENANLFRMADPDAELSLVRHERDSLGMNHVRFQQRYNGVEVFGGVLIAHARGTRVDSITGSYFPGLDLDTRPTLTIEQAADRARDAAGSAGATLVRERSGLAIYAKGAWPALTWKVELVEPAGDGRWLVFVDARDGRIAHAITMTQTARNRITYTDNNTGGALPGTKLCDEANPSGCDANLDAKTVHDYTGRVYDYYQDRFGRDSIDGQGMAMISTVNYGVDYNNAFWSGSQMVYGDGDGVLMEHLGRSLDVVAHELTHGVTQHTADLVYEDQPGALNESYSDVLGVFADAYGRGSTQANWQLGEHIWTPGIAGDALRDMADPHKGNDPFTNNYNCLYRPGQPYYCGQPASMGEFARLPISFFEEVPSDTGGVHINSGIPNKAAYLIVQGGSFGGVAVAGIGVAKAEQIYYRTLANYLTPYSTFMDARNASIQACADLVGTFGITANNCASVRAGFAAVGIGSQTALTQSVHLPVAANSAILGNAPAFSGKVTFNNAPAENVAVQLRLCDDREGFCDTASTVATATTDAFGVYRFATGASIPATDAHTWYRVVYFTPSNAPDGRLLTWIGDDIGTYVKGNSISLDPFDIADVTYISPNDATPRNFPLTFTWNARAAGGDYYIWEAYDQDFNLLAIEYPFLMHSQASFTLQSAADGQLQPGSGFDGAVYWDVMVVSKAGHGITWNSGEFAINAGQGIRADAFAERRAQAERLANQLHPNPTLALNR